MDTINARVASQFALTCLLSLQSLEQRTEQHLVVICRGCPAAWSTQKSQYNSSTAYGLGDYGLGSAEEVFQRTFDWKYIL